MNEQQQRTAIAQATAAALVLDRSHIKQFRAGITMMGGGWLIGLQMFEKHPRFKFLFLVAPNKERIHRAAPLVLMAASLNEFHACVHSTVAMMDDVNCLWVRAIEGKPLRILGDAILGDAVPGGSA